MNVLCVRCRFVNPQSAIRIPHFIQSCVEEPVAIDKQEFRRVLGHFAAGVTVITTVGDDGAPYGLTATAFTSVSLEPPLVLVCVDKKSESHPHFHVSRVFAVNFLATGHEDLSRRFAVSGGAKFDGLSVRQGATGAPLLTEALGYLE